MATSQTEGNKNKKNSNGRDYFGWIRQTSAPACLIECAFVDNKKDIAIIDTAAEQKTMGIAIAKGVLKTLGIKWVAEKTYSITATASKLTKAKADTLAKELKGKGFTVTVK